MNRTPKLPQDLNLETLLHSDSPEYMQHCLERRIIEWNRERNSLRFDMELELQMLKEEVREFFASTTFYNMLREYADFLFVYTGACAKYLNSNNSTVEHFVQEREKWSDIQSWARDVREDMLRILLDQLDVYGMQTEEEAFILLDRVVEAVVEANENKGKEKDASGKIQKGPNYVPPEETIQEILRQTIGRVQ